MAEIRPQPGPQETFLATPADIAIYGGAAGGGKSHALLMEPLRHVAENQNFKAVLFRRTLADAKKPGGTWDQMIRMYGALGAKPRNDNLSWRFTDGGKITVGHLEHETTVMDWQGAEVPLLLFDELTHFSRAQFFYLLSRNRSLCGVRPYVRATCNPDADSWVAEFVEWWIDQGTGLPIPERGGKLRWFVRINDALVWGDTREGLIAAHGPKMQPKSVTFVPASIYDNRALMKGDPGYLANLMALPLVERSRLLGGNWKIRPSAGLYFQRAWCEFVETAPPSVRSVRYWDLAATEKTPANDPDWTVGVRMSRSEAGLYCIEHAIRLRAPPGRVEQTISNTASADGKAVRVGIPQDPGQAGKAQASYLSRQLAGYAISSERETGDKIVRFSPFSSQALAGNVKIVRGTWNSEYLDSLEAFPEATHDDDVDATSGAFTALLRKGASSTSELRL